MKAGVSLPSVTAAKKSIVKEEMAHHCRRRTRGVKYTAGAIEALLLSFATATDTLGVPLLKDEMQEIWEEQKHHLACLQDPPGVELYTITGHINKGGVRLPVLRCARRSTSLESFHLHLAGFVPGTAVSAVNFHAFLLDGLTWWNSARAAAAIQPEERVRTFDMRLASKVNALSHIVHSKAVLPLLNPPSEYTYSRWWIMQHSIQQVVDHAAFYPAGGGSCSILSSRWWIMQHSIQQVMDHAAFYPAGGGSCSILSRRWWAYSWRPMWPYTMKVKKCIELIPLNSTPPALGCLTQ